LIQVLWIEEKSKEEPPHGDVLLYLWVSSVDYSSDVPISKNILKQMFDVLSQNLQYWLVSFGWAICMILIKKFQSASNC